jgi:TetR/AcrR family transcriptional repressor of lfrA
MDESERGVRARTRRAILDAALTVLSDNPAAPLTDIAVAADVGRSTLHRYFPERADLMRALARHVHALSTAAIAAAEPTSGPPAAALRRVVESHLEIGAIVGYIYTDPAVLADPELVAFMETGDEEIIEILNRATVDRPNIPPGWARRVFWALLQAGFDAMKFDGMPRHQVADAIMASLTEPTIAAPAAALSS